MSKYENFYLRERAKSRSRAEGKAQEKIGIAEVKSSEKIKLKELNAKLQLERRKLKLSQQSVKQRISNLGKLRVAPYLSQEQEMIGELFGGGGKVIFGNEESESKVNISGALMPNQFADEIDIDSDQTATSFGFGKFKQRSGLF